MIRISLPDAEVGRLEEVLRAATDAKLRHRVQLVLMAHRGRRNADIAADTGTSHRSVTRWLNAYLDGGLDALRPTTAPGAAPKLTPDLAPLLRQWVIDGPAKHGLDRANWTYPELADHLHRVTGIRVGKSALQAFGARHGLRVYRPTYKYLRGDPAKQATAREEIAALKKRRRRGRSSC